MAVVPGLPTPLPPWARVAVWLAEPALWSTINFLVDHFSEEEDPDDFSWRRVVSEFTRASPTGIDDDKAQFKLDLLNITGGQPDPTWNDADFLAVEAKLNTFHNAMASSLGSDHTLTRYKWYRMRFQTPYDPTKRFADTGPPVRQVAKNVPGGRSPWLPHQIAMSITLKTSVPRHWGRFYYPSPGSGLLEGTTGEGGRWTDAFTVSAANNAAQMVNDLYEADFQVIVPVTQIDKVQTRGYLTTTEVQVDDIPDVIRRRRPRAPQVRTIGVYT